MTKIVKVQNPYIENVNKFANGRQVPVKELKENKKEDAVVANVKPEVENPEEAGAIADTIAARLQKAPEAALAAQGDLDEAKILALLQDDDE